MTKKNLDIPGDAYGSAILHQRMLLATGMKVQEMNFAFEALREKGIQVKRVTFRCDGIPSGSWLAIVTAVTAEGPVVAFNQGEGFLATIEGLANRIKNGSLKWREDDYAK